MNIFKIKGSILFWMTAFLCVLTGTFREFFLFMSLILIHECGHALFAFLLHWKIKEIILYPFGGVTVFEEKLNRPMWEELLILLAGPLAQLGYYYFALLYFSFPPIFSFYHHILLLFNLIPIYPLDGGRLFSLFYQTFFPYIKSHRMMIMTSFFFLFLFFCYFSFYHSSFFLCIYFFLLAFKIVEEKKKESYIFEKFLLERSLYHFIFPFQKHIEGNHLETMYRDCDHCFHIHGRWVKEKDILRKRFDL